jgi:hypothetical protein
MHTCVCVCVCVCERERERERERESIPKLDGQEGHETNNVSILRILRERDIPKLDGEGHETHLTIALDGLEIVDNCWYRYQY